MKIDLCHTYHPVHITEGEEWKTTFCTCYDSFKWLVMPFGLTIAPMAFQRFMNNMFSDLPNMSVVIYLDDILIYSNDMSKHKQHVKEVLWRLQKRSLYANADKCEFHKTTVEYLRYILSPDGLFMDKTKVQTIVNWPEPCKVKNVQSFLGFTNFYHQFIHGYSDIVIPLTCLTRKNSLWKFDSKCRAAFEKLKEEFTQYFTLPPLV